MTPDSKFLNAQALSRLVSETVPADRRNAVVMTADAEGVALVFKMIKPTDHGRWEIEAAFRRNWDGNTGMDAKVVYSW